MSTSLPYITIPYLAYEPDDPDKEVVCVVDHVWNGEETLAIVAYDDGSVGELSIGKIRVLSLAKSDDSEELVKRMAWQSFETGHQPYPTVDAEEAAAIQAAIAEGQVSMEDIEVTHTPYSEMGPGAGTPAPVPETEETP